MAKKEVNVFGASFLDLLSGALGAVIILYVIVPKLNIPVEEFEEQQQLAEEIMELGFSIEELSEMIPLEDFEELRSRLNSISEANENLRAEMERMRARIAEMSDVPDAEGIIEDLQQQVAELQQEVENVSDALANCEEGIAQCEADLEKIEGESQFMVVILSWSTEYHDVDLHIVDPQGNEFMYTNRTYPNAPGELTVDNTCGPGYEVWNITAPPSGNYEIYANLYSRNGSGCEGSNPSNALTEISVYHRNGVRTYDDLVLAQESEKKLISTVTVSTTGPFTFN